MSLKKCRHTDILQNFIRKVNKKCFQLLSLTKISLHKQNQDNYAQQRYCIARIRYADYWHEKCARKKSPYTRSSKVYSISNSCDTTDPGLILQIYSRSKRELESANETSNYRQYRKNYICAKRVSESTFENLKRR